MTSILWLLLIAYLNIKPNVRHLGMKMQRGFFSWTIVVAFMSTAYSSICL